MKGTGINVTSSVEYFDAPAAAAIAAAFASSPKLAACSKEAFTADIKRNAPDGFGVGPAEVAPLEFPKLGQATVAFRVRSTVEPTPGLKVPINHDAVFVFKGDAVIRFTFLAPGQPFDPALERTLVDAVVGRA